MMVNLRKMRIKSAENSQRSKSSSASNSTSTSSNEKLSQDHKLPAFNISCTDEDLDSQKEDTTEETTMPSSFKNER